MKFGNHFFNIQLIAFIVINKVNEVNFVSQTVLVSQQDTPTQIQDKCYSLII